MMDHQAIIELNQVKKQIGDYELGPIDLRLEPGMILAIVGPNGAGKSTLFRLMMNMLQPKEGNIHIFGKAYTENEVAIKQKVAYVPESFYHPDMTITLRMEAAFIKHWYPDWNEELYQRLVLKYELPLDKKLKECSKGTLRRMELIHALASGAKLLLLDEPSSGLDPFVWREWMADLREWMEEGDRSVVIATHIMEEVKKLADFIAVLNRGEWMDVVEKDALQDGWRKLWLDRQLSVGKLPGVAYVQHEPAPMIVTNDPALLEKTLASFDIQIIKRQALELDEILYYLLRMKECR